jgi:glycosyltransferase involved in cell wall biosynthesis
MSGAARPLKILHVLRSPVGGLFRHVLDLSRGQAARGHQVGIVADAATGGDRAEEAFAALLPHLALGLSRVPMSRHIGFSDVGAWRHVAHRAAAFDVDVLHGHGAKGGAYVRLTSTRAIRVYTPHGGSLHYERTSPAGLIYLTLEQLLMRRTELFLFESHYGSSVFAAKVGSPRTLARIVHNGVAPDEFEKIAPQENATDIVFVGELRVLKGVDVLLDAIALLAAQGRSVSATIVGAGPDAEQFEAQASRLGLTSVRFLPPMAARAAFALGRLLVAPSRAESLPYIILETAAAAVPLLTTAVGGIPEVFGPQSNRLIPPGDPPALANAVRSALADPDALRNETLTLQSRVQAEFSVAVMTDAVLAAYREALAVRGR